MLLFNVLAPFWLLPNQERYISKSSRPSSLFIGLLFSKQAEAAKLMSLPY